MFSESEQGRALVLVCELHFLNCIIKSWVGFGLSSSRNCCTVCQALVSQSWVHCVPGTVWCNCLLVILNWHTVIIMPRYSSHLPLLLWHCWFG